MTLILTAQSPGTIWMLADRRLSRGPHTLSDDAVKVLTLETSDGQALLGYSGLGRTAAGVQPSDWMSAALRGGNGTLEQALLLLREAMAEQFLPHLAPLETDHSVLVTAFVNGE